MRQDKDSFRHESLQDMDTIRDILEALLKPGRDPRDELPAPILRSASSTASEPGTYTYYSGTNSGLQVEMGLVGAIIVRPKISANTPMIRIMEKTCIWAG